MQLQSGTMTNDRWQHIASWGLHLSYLDVLLSSLSINSFSNQIRESFGLLYMVVQIVWTNSWLSRDDTCNAYKRLTCEIKKLQWEFMHGQPPQDFIIIQDVTVNSYSHMVMDANCHLMFHEGCMVFLVLLTRQK